MATPHNSRTTAQAPLPRLRSAICARKMLDHVGLRYPHRASGAKAPRTLRPLPLLRFAVSATGGAHLCSTKYYLRFLLSSLHFSLAASALRIMRYCPKKAEALAASAKFVTLPGLHSKPVQWKPCSMQSCHVQRPVHPYSLYTGKPECLHNAAHTG